MIGDMIAKIRKDKHMSKTELASLTNINIGHLTHIEKGERNPSHKALKSICNALEIPYQPLMYTYDQILTEEQNQYLLPNHILYNKVPAVSSIEKFFDCPSSVAGASIALKCLDDSMEPRYKKDSYVYVQFNCALSNKDFGVFYYNNEILLRRFVIRQDGLVLRAEKKEISDIIISSKDEFYIIGKILGSANS